MTIVDEIKTNQVHHTLSKHESSFFNLSVFYILVKCFFFEYLGV